MLFHAIETSWWCGYSCTREYYLPIGFVEPFICGLFTTDQTDCGHLKGLFGMAYS
jgi:hypothetical protein